MQGFLSLISTDLTPGSGRCAGCWLQALGSPQHSLPSLRKDCRGNTEYAVSPEKAGCNQCFNEVLEVKCCFNLLIALRGWQIALYHFFLSCKLIKRYRGAFKWGIAGSQMLFVCMRILAGTAVPLFFWLSRGSESSCGGFLNMYLWVSGAEKRENKNFNTVCSFFLFTGWVVCCSFSVQRSWCSSSHPSFWKRAYRIFLDVFICQDKVNNNSNFAGGVLFHQTRMSCGRATQVYGRARRGASEHNYPQKKGCLQESVV